MDDGPVDEESARPQSGPRRRGKGKLGNGLCQHDEHVRGEAGHRRNAQGTPAELRRRWWLQVKSRAGRRISPSFSRPVGGEYAGFGAIRSSPSSCSARRLSRSSSLSTLSWSGRFTPRCPSGTLLYLTTRLLGCVTSLASSIPTVF